MEHNYEVKKLCVKEYLRYIAGIETTLKTIEDEIAYQDSRITLNGVSYDGEGSSGNAENIQEKGILRLIAARTKWTDTYATFADDLVHAKELCLPVYMNRYVLWLHYVERKTWHEISEAIGYSVRSVRYMANSGYSDLYDVMPETFRRFTIPNAMS